MHSASLNELSDEQLFREILRLRAEGRSVNDALGRLTARWESPARYVIRRIQKSYGKGAEDDEMELYQEAVMRFVEKGLDQFRGLSERYPGAAASPKTFFLRIAKHAAIDRYRASREVSDTVPSADDENEVMESPAQTAKSVERSKAAETRREDSELYWRAFDRLEKEHPNEASAWRLYHHEDLEDHGQVAEKLSISVANSYKRVSRAQAWLRMYLLELQEEQS
ncbi:MAG: RNA polymerase sigma factor [Myxococcaceae bacterium]